MIQRASPGAAPIPAANSASATAGHHHLRLAPPPSLDHCLYLVRRHLGSQIANKLARRLVVPPTGRVKPAT